MPIPGKFGLQYVGVDATNPPNFYKFNRPPTIFDNENFVIGAIWLHQIEVAGNPPTYDTSTIWTLVAQARGIATWIRVGKSSITGDVITTTYDVPGVTGTHVLNANSGIVEIFAWGGGNSGAGSATSMMTAPGGGGGGGYMHYTSPASYYGGGGSSVSFTTAAITPGGIVGSSVGNVGAPTIFGSLSTPISEVNPYNLNAPFLIGAPSFDNSSFMDYAWFQFIGVEVAALASVADVNSPINFLGHYNNSSVTPITCWMPSLPGGGGNGATMPPGGGVPG
ncbi:MAG TPA: hypothetical protein VGF75_06715, partial [Candidatus Saccharimonadales bacterium]